MKLISFTVPCYNSAAYMHICIDSLLTGGDRVEIIIVDDGIQRRDRAPSPMPTPPNIRIPSK